MSKLDDILKTKAGEQAKWLQEYHELGTDLLKFDHPADRVGYYQLNDKTKQQIKDLMLEIVDETAFAYKDGMAYANVVRKKVEEL